MNRTIAQSHNAIQSHNAVAEQPGSSGTSFTNSSLTRSTLLPRSVPLCVDQVNLTTLQSTSAPWPPHVIRTNSCFSICLRIFSALLNMDSWFFSRAAKVFLVSFRCGVCVSHIELCMCRGSGFRATSMVDSNSSTGPAI